MWIYYVVYMPKEGDIFQQNLLCSGCSIVGFNNTRNYHYIHVDEEHVSLKLMLHIMFHILGRYHEHQRADRREYITIIKDNVIEGKKKCKGNLEDIFTKLV